MFLEDLEQVKALAVSIRVEILNILEKEPMTTTQIARILRERPNKLYYHVTELERVGILEVAETRQKGNLVEKYYVPAARFFRIDPSLFQKGEEGREAFFETVSSHFDSTLVDLRKSLASGALDSELLQKSVSSVIETRLSEEEAVALSKELRDLVMRHGTTGGEGPVKIHCISVFYMKRAELES
jgi:DNA-binding transcriptional ArsR family regulator